MHGKKMLHAAVAASTLLATTYAAAVDDHFDRSKYEKGGFAPDGDPTYVKECGGCHFTYLAGMLPARSWHALLGRKDHFGESLSLAPGTLEKVEGYLTANAADRSSYDGSKVILTRLDEQSTPIRITQLPLMKQYHALVSRLITATVVPVKSLANCDSCHADANTGDFGLKKIHVPGVVSGGSNGT